MMTDKTDNLGRFIKVSQRDNYQSFSKAAKYVGDLVEEQSWAIDPKDSLRGMKEAYFDLADALIEGQQRNHEKMRVRMKESAAKVSAFAILFHLNFFQPSLLGLAEGRAVRRLISDMKKTFTAKNTDYGNAFRFWGVAGLIVRIGDKYFRLEQLVASGGKRQKVEAERIPDTALDLANYAIMLIILLDEKRSLKLGE